MANKFGIREVCNVKFRKIAGIGPNDFIIDTAKMTTIEGASTTVYAQGGLGNSRLMAWEGEKTITFTLEDALMSLDGFSALTGTTATTSGTVKKFDIKTTSFAGTYEVTAKTLFRDENGVDHVATITVPKAKLQSNLNLSMSPTGDPSAFTYTFDALADTNKTLFILEIDEAEGDADDVIMTATTKIEIDGTALSVTVPDGATKLTLAVDQTAGEDKKYGITLKGNDTSATSAATITTKLGENDRLTNLYNIVLEPGESTDIALGSDTTWYVI